MKTLRQLLAVAFLFVTVAAVPAGAVPITVTQQLTFAQIGPFGTYTTSTLSAGGWSLNPFPFTQANQISQVTFAFSSTNGDYADGIGPTGGNAGVNIGILNDTLQRSSLASVDIAHPQIVLASFNGAIFTTLTSLMADGQLTMSLGAFEGFPTFTRTFTLGATSTLTVTVQGDAPAPAPVPEPATLGFVGVGLVALARKVRRPRQDAGGSR
jgi:hypothetical protein